MEAKTQISRIKVGCCGFPVARSKYFETFDIVELQQTFYQPPQISTALKWAKESGEGFEYTMKAWQLITHEPKSPTYRRLKIPISGSRAKNYGSFKPTGEVLDAWEETREIARALNASIIVFQCPASFAPTDENKRNMRAFFSSVERESSAFAWEPRGAWSEGEIEQLCRDLELMHVVDPFQSRPVWGNIRYFRLHGRGGYRYRYTEEDLDTLKKLPGEAVPAYFMFNNVYMYEDALALKNLLSQTGEGKA